MTSLTAQLSLPVHLSDDQTFDSYYAAGNDELMQVLQACAAGAVTKTVYVWGSVKSGRTHLMHASCAQANQLNRNSFYLPLTNYTKIAIEMLQGLEFVDLICIDDIDAIAGHLEWEEAIFDLYNRIVEQKNCTLIVSSRTSAVDGKFVLADLVSRMQWGLTYQLQPLNDEGKLIALQRRATIRGLNLSADVGQFLLNRLTRDLQTLFDVLDKLDKASLIHQRRLTIPFVKQVLEL